MVTIQDLGPDISEELFSSTMSPETVEEYLRLWQTINVNALKSPFNKFYNKRQNEDDVMEQEEAPCREDFDSMKDYLLYRWRIIFKRWEIIPNDERDFQNFADFKAIPEFWGHVIAEAYQRKKGIVITVA